MNCPIDPDSREEREEPVSATAGEAPTAWVHKGMNSNGEFIGRFYQFVKENGTVSERSKVMMTMMVGHCSLVSTPAQRQNYERVGWCCRSTHLLSRS